MAMAMAELPCDVIEAILLWLPIKSLMRFKCVGKSWCALIRNPYFAEQHSALRPDATHLLISYSLRYYPKTEQTILTTTTTTNGGAPPPISPNVLEHGPFFLSCCHGLISMHPRDKAKANTFVYNPNTRETLSVLFNNDAFKDCTSVRSFIGFEPVSNQYKLMILSSQYEDIPYINISKHCEIITLGGTNNYWRQVVFNPIPFLDGHSTCLNGALHWLTIDGQRIVVFDLKSDKFGTILVPEGIKQWCSYNLCQVHGRLILVESGVYERDASFELWTLKDYSSGVWVKQSFKFSMPEYFNVVGRYLDVVGGLNNDEILISLGREAFGYDIKTKKSRKIDVRGERETYLEEVMLCTESMRCY